MTQAGPVSSALAIDLVTDGRTWERWKVRVGVGSCLSLWARGIPDGCEYSHIFVLLDAAALPAVFVEEVERGGLKQVNAMIPSGFDAGPVMIRLQCDTEISKPAAIELIR